MKYSGRQATREGAVGKGLPISPFAISPHYNTSCKLVICASLFFYKETPGYEGTQRKQHYKQTYISNLKHVLFEKAKLIIYSYKYIKSIKIYYIEVTLRFTIHFLILVSPSFSLQNISFKLTFTLFTYIISFEVEMLH
jgi:hypothetical protein